MLLKVTLSSQWHQGRNQTSQESLTHRSTQTSRSYQMFPLQKENRTLRIQM